MDDLWLLFDAALVLFASFDALVAWHHTIALDLFLSARDTRHGLSISALGRWSSTFGFRLLLLRLELLL